MESKKYQKNQDPYKTLISEIMLQQTRVKYSYNLL